MLKTALQVVTGLIITVAWGAALISGILTHDYQGLTLTTPIMGIYVGYIFGADVVKKVKAKIADS